MTLPPQLPGTPTLIARLRELISEHEYSVREYETHAPGFRAQTERDLKETREELVKFVADALAAKSAECERLRDDAARYRWLRGDHKNFAIMQNVGYDWTRLEPQECDAAIDATMKEKQ